MTTSRIAQYGYDPRTRRYRNLSSGRIVAEKEVRAAVDVVIDTETAKIRALSQRLVEGQINLSEWQLQMSATMKRLHVATGAAAFGGTRQMSASDQGYLGSLIKEQYKFLRGFAKQIKSGTQKLDGSLVARAELYTQAARGTHEAVRARGAKQIGQTEMRSLLAPADHCTQCLQEAAKGWSSIGSLIPIGGRTCKARCRCSMSYR